MRSRDEESQPKYARNERDADYHAPTCKTRHPNEAVILTQCGMKVLRCWMETHLDFCFQAKGKCFYPR